MNSNVVKSRRIHDATVLVCRGGEKLGELTKGDMTSDTPFLLASVSKLYTHAMIFQLIDKGYFTYETAVADLLPDSAERVPYSHTVTIRHMIDQTSGFANYEMDRQADGTRLLDEVLKQDRTVGFDEALDRLNNLPHKFPPGAKNRAYYSDINALLLGKIIERVTAQPLTQALEAMICKPLGLRQTRFVTLTDTLVPIYNGTHAIPANGIKYLAGQMAQGGIMATNTELMSFLQAFFEGTLFDVEHTKDPIFRPIQFIPMKYGSGMMQLAIPRLLCPFIPAPEIRGHSGVTGSFAFYCPSKQVFITGTINQMKLKPYSIIYKLLASIT